MTSKEPGINLGVTDEPPSRIPIMVATRRPLHSETASGLLRTDSLMSRAYSFPEGLYSKEGTRLGNVERNGEQAQSNDNTKGYSKPRNLKPVEHVRQPSPTSRTSSMPNTNRHIYCKETQQSGNERKRSSSGSPRAFSPKVNSATPLIPESRESGAKEGALNLKNEPRGYSKPQKNNSTILPMGNQNQNIMCLKAQHNMDQIKGTLKESVVPLIERKGPILKPIQDGKCDFDKEIDKESKVINMEEIDKKLNLTDSIEKMQGQKSMIAEKLQIIISLVQQYEQVINILDEGKDEPVGIQVFKINEDLDKVKLHQLNLEERIRKVASECYEIADTRNQLLCISDYADNIKLMQTMREKLQDLEKQNKLVMAEKSDLQSEHQKEIEKLYQQHEKELSRSSDLEDKCRIQEEKCLLLEEKIMQLQSKISESQERQQNFETLKTIEDSIAKTNSTMINLKKQNDDLGRQIVLLKEKHQFSKEQLSTQLKEKEEEIKSLKKKVDNSNVIMILKDLFQLSDEDVDETEWMSYINIGDYEKLKIKIKTLRFSKNSEYTEDHIIALLKNDESHIKFHDLRDVVIHNMNKQLSQQKTCLLKLFKNIEDKHHLSTLVDDETYEMVLSYIGRERGPQLAHIMQVS